MNESTRHFLRSGVVPLAAVGIGAILFVYSGVYDIGADAPHTKVVLTALQMLRTRSIARRARDLSMPNLHDPDRILKGAGQYAAMCTGCHLAPGVKDSELRTGLYPKPPNLSRTRIDPREAFWVIKHGIKMSAMPAWGTTHDDATIWTMVAFLEELPTMTPAQYRAIVAKAPPDEDMDMGSEHDAGSRPGESKAGRSDMPGMRGMQYRESRRPRESNNGEP